MADGEDLSPIQRDLRHPPSLTIAHPAGFPQSRVRHKQKLVIALVTQGQTVPAGPDRAPGIQNGSACVIDQHLIVPVVTDHEEPPILYLHHLMAIQNGVMPALTGKHPVFDHSIAMSAVTDDGVLGRLRRQSLGPNGSSRT